MAGFDSTVETQATHKMLYIKRLSEWRMGRDSNPRYLAVHTLSRRAQSTALAPIQGRQDIEANGRLLQLNLDAPARGLSRNI